MSTTGILEGDLAGDGLVEAFESLARARSTGVLTVQSDEDIVAISFEEGAIVGADALNETLEDGLGRALISQGLLTEAQFRDVLGRVRTERRRLGEVLADQKMLSEGDYLAALRRYTVSLVESLVTWRRGDFKFYEGDEVSYETGFEAIRVGEVSAPSGSGEVAEPVSGPPEVETPVAGEAGSFESPGEILVDEPLPSGPFLEVDEVDLLEVEPERPPAGPLATLRDSLAFEVGESPPWLGWLIPALTAALLFAMVWMKPNSLLFPAFWLEPERLEFERQRRASAYLKIDRAARTFFLLEGRFPDDLHTLVSRGLLSNDDIVGSRGHILTYIPGDRGYVIRSAVTDGTDPGVNREEAIIGDFFLDPEFVILSPRTDSVPLVLLD